MLDLQRIGDTYTAMHRHFSFVALIASLCLFLSVLPAFSAQQTPRLFFSKRISVPKNRLLQKHIVKQGEHLFKILRSYNIAEKDLWRAAKLCADLNPNIKNLDKLEPGQKLIIPLTTDVSLADQGKVEIDYKQKAFGQFTKQYEYVVKPGDRVAKILREATGLPDHVIFSQYIEAFSKLNPDIANVDKLEVGQKVAIPLPPGVKPPKGATLAEIPTGKTPIVGIPTSPPTISGKTGSITIEPTEPLKPLPPKTALLEEPVKKEITPEDKKNFLLSVFQSMGFKFSPGTELLYPIKGSTWFKVNLKKTPLGRTPWGEEFALVPEKHANLEKRFKEIYHNPIIVPDNWNPKDILEVFEEKTKGKIKTWSSRYPLILNHDGLIIELKASILVRMQGSQFFLINIIDENQKPASPHLQAFFREQNVVLNEWEKEQYAIPRRLPTKKVNRDAIYVPSINRFNAWKDIRPLLSDTGIETPQQKDLDAVLDILDEKGLVSRKPIRVTWFAGENRELNIILPVTVISEKQRNILLLEPGKASPHLVALLSLKGYECLAIR